MDLDLRVILLSCIPDCNVNLPQSQIDDCGCDAYSSNGFLQVYYNGSVELSGFTNLNGNPDIGFIKLLASPMLLEFVYGMFFYWAMDYIKKCLIRISFSLRASRFPSAPSLLAIVSVTGL